MTKNAIIEDLFVSEKFNEFIDKMEPAHLREDLKQEVALVLLEMPDENFALIRRVDYFAVGIIRNMICTKTSAFYKKYRHSNFIYVDEWEGDGMDRRLNVAVNKEEYSLQDRLLKEELEDYTLSEIDSLYWYDSEMIKLYMRLGTFRAIQEMTGIPHVSCFKTIKKALSVLKRKMSLPPHERPTPLFSRSELNQIRK